MSLIVCSLTLDLSGVGGPASNYATTGIALEVIGSHKPHHHDKVEKPLTGLHNLYGTHIMYKFAADCITRPGRAMGQTPTL